MNYGKSKQEENTTKYEQRSLSRSQYTNLLSHFLDMY